MHHKNNSVIEWRYIGDRTSFSNSVFLHTVLCSPFLSRHERKQSLGRTLSVHLFLVLSICIFSRLANIWTRVLPIWGPREWYPCSARRSFRKWSSIPCTSTACWYPPKVLWKIIGLVTLRIYTAAEESFRWCNSGFTARKGQRLQEAIIQNRGDDGVWKTRKRPERESQER